MSLIIDDSLQTYNIRWNKNRLNNPILLSYALTELYLMYDSINTLQNSKNEKR